MRSMLRHAPLRALRRSPALSVLMIATLAFGVAVWLTAHTVAWSFARDPMHDAQALWRVELIRHTEIREILRGTDMAFVSEMALVLLTPGDVEELSRSGIPSRTAAITSAEISFQAPGERAGRLGWVRFAGRDAFALFGIRLAAGRVFDEGRRELLISESNARAWFGGADDAVEKVLQVAGEGWRIAGVVADGAAVGRRMHIADGALEPALWLPFGDATRLRVLPFNRHPAPGGGFAFASLWVELGDGDAAARFRGWLARWSTAHQAAGVPRIRRYQEWSGVLGTPPAYRVLELFGVATLAACALTLVRLFHARNRFHRQDIALQRALGASRASVLTGALLEAAVIAAAGVAAAVPLAAGALAALDGALALQSASVTLQPSRIVLASAIGLWAGVCAALLPAWRACAEPPARALRSGP